MHDIFQDRTEAGKRLAKKLATYHNSNAVILAIPRGGIPVAASAAHRLNLEWNVIVTRKLPIPWNPEAGFGAIAADGSMVLNHSMVQGLGLEEPQIEEIAHQVRDEVVRRTEIFSEVKPPADTGGKTVVVMDDGLASGYTMLAAIKSARAHGAEKIVAAAPVASRSSATLIEEAADEVVFEVVSPSVPFAVADFYIEWHDLTDEDVLPYLRGEK